MEMKKLNEKKIWVASMVNTTVRQLFSIFNDENDNDACHFPLPRQGFMLLTFEYTRNRQNLFIGNDISQT